MKLTQKLTARTKAEFTPLKNSDLRAACQWLAKLSVQPHNQLPLNMWEHSTVWHLNAGQLASLHYESALLMPGACSKCDLVLLCLYYTMPGPDAQVM